MDKTNIPTFLKWAGGKVSLLQKYELLFPNDVETYFEPFLGSGAVFFHIKQYHKPTSILLSDVNEELINCWNVVKEGVEELIRLLKIHSKKHNKRYYYKIRKLGIEKLTKTERAARLIYLNRTCFNGLYRVNSKGQFNVPMGDYKNPRIVDEAGLREASKLLKNVEIETKTYKDILNHVRAGDFVYIDPPYHPISETSNFTSYTQYPFLMKEQEELVEFCKKLDKKGCNFMLSNSNSKTIRMLYKDFNIIEVTAKRMISADSSKRGYVKELVIINYKPQPVRTQLTLI